MVVYERIVVCDATMRIHVKYVCIVSVDSASNREQPDDLEAFIIEFKRLNLLITDTTITFKL